VSSGQEPDRVSFRKQVSDGNYGSEVAEVSVDVDIVGQGDEAIAAALALARRLVHAELRESPSAAIRRALEYPKPIEEQVWQDAERSAEYELAAGLRDNARADLEDLPFGDDE